MKNNAIYAGSFDPITNGHIDVINRACRLFDQVIVGVSLHHDKHALFSVEERVQLIRSVFSGNKQVVVEGFDGLLVAFANQKKIHTLVRGLRALSDFEYEFQMALTNRSIDSSVETVFLMTDAKYAYLSSSHIKHLASLKAPIGEFVPSIVKEKLEEKYS